MKHTRRTYLEAASALAIGSAGLGALWEAVYATRANPPSEGNAYWTKVGDCQ